MREGIQLAQSEKSPIVQVLFEDDRSIDKAAALSAAHKLIHRDNVELVYSWTSATMPVIRSVTHQRGVPLIVGSYDHATFSHAKDTYSLFVNYDLIAEEMARSLITLHKRNDIALITSTDTWSEGFVAPFISTATQLSKNTVEHVKISPNETDLRTVVAMIKKRGIRAIAAPIYGPPLYALLREIHRYNMSEDARGEGGQKFIVHVADGIFKEDLEELGEATEGVLASQVWLENSEFAAKYREVFHRSLSPTELGLVAEGYDLYALFESVARARRATISTPLTTLHTSLGGTRLEGLLGSIALSIPPATSGHRQVIVRNRSFQLIP